MGATGKFDFVLFGWCWGGMSFIFLPSGPSSLVVVLVIRGLAGAPSLESRVVVVVVFGS